VNSRSSSSSTWSGKEPLGLVEWSFQQARCLSCHLTISVIALTGTQSINPNQWPWSSFFIHHWTSDGRSLTPYTTSLTQVPSVTLKYDQPRDKMSHIGRRAGHIYSVVTSSTRISNVTYKPHSAIMLHIAWPWNQSYGFVKVSTNGTVDWGECFFNLC